MSVRIIGGTDILHLVNTAAFRTSLHGVFTSHLVSPIRNILFGIQPQ